MTIRELERNGGAIVQPEPRRYVAMAPEGQVFLPRRTRHLVATELRTLEWRLKSAKLAHTEEGI